MMQAAKTSSGKSKLVAAAGVLVVCVGLLQVARRQETRAVAETLQVAQERDILDIGRAYSSLADSFYASDRLSCLLDSYPKLEQDEKTRLDGLVRALGENPFRCEDGERAKMLGCNAVGLAQAAARKVRSDVVAQYRGVVGQERFVSCVTTCSTSAPSWEWKWLGR